MTLHVCGRDVCHTFVAFPSAMIDSTSGIRVYVSSCYSPTGLQIEIGRSTQLQSPDHPGAAYLGENNLVYPLALNKGS